MNVKELRLGNYVKFRFNIIQVSSISCSGINLEAYYDYYGCQERIKARVLKDQIKPIPLTEEWLLKLGFIPTDLSIKRSFDVTTYNNRWHGVFLEYHFAGWYMTTPHIVKEIKWVHQIQNLYFSVTQEELTIKD